ncbi:MAG: chorismate mutase [Christensenellaceae bacterium]|nr:chorismate mutase [Christensenellaceae bacterium]
MNNLKKLREEIDLIDNELMPLFLKRMGIIAKMAKEKHSLGLEIYSPEREAEILKNVSQKSGDMEAYATELYNKLFELSRNYQKDIIGKIIS